MLRKTLVALLLIQATGCATMSNTESGAIGGGLLGGLCGAVIGSAFRAPAAGAAIGAGVGALAGASSGAREDRAEARANAEVAAAVQAQQARQLGLMEIATMARSGNSDIVIINQIRATGSVYNLTPEQVTWLHTSGVSDAVITEMQARQGSAVIYSPRYVRPVYVAPAPVVGVVYTR